MDICAAVRGYVWKMMDAAGPGMKLLLLDRDTMPIISLAVAQSELLQKEVYAFEILENISRDPMPHLKAVAFIRPTDDSIARLADELRHPKYGQYYVYLSNAAPKQLVKALADSDESEAVRDLQEFFADYLALTPSLFTLDLSGCLSLPAYDWASADILSRTARSLAAVMLSLRKFPVAIRYSAQSSPSRRLAESLNQLVSRERELFDFGQNSTNWGSGTRSLNPASCITVVLVDRRQDCVTPLVSPWSYISMAHEHVGLHHNRVSLAESELDSSKSETNEKENAAELESIVLSPVHDEFFLQNMFLYFGEIGATIRKLVDEFQQRHRQQSSVESLQDLRAFVATYPTFRRLQGNVTRHVTLVSELSQKIDKWKLMEISECEQMLAAKRYSYEEALSNVRRFCGMSNHECRPIDCFRLAAIFGLTYKVSEADFAANVEDLLRKRGGWMTEKGIRLLRALVFNYGRENLSVNSTVQAIQQGSRRLLQGIRGVENVYTLHQPKVRDIVQAQSNSSSAANKFSNVWNLSSTSMFGTAVIRPLADSDNPSGPEMEAQNQNLLVFFIGGVTYAECTSLLSSNPQPGRVIVGGTSVINSVGFIREIEHATGGLGFVSNNNPVNVRSGMTASQSLNQMGSSSYRTFAGKMA